MLRHPLRRDDGFTLVELLVVVLIIGVLAAIGLAVMLNQREKAQDSVAKSAASTAGKAMLVYGSEHGDFSGAAPADLLRIERSLTNATGLDVDSTASTFTVTVESVADPGASFSVERRATGELVRTCALPGTGACQADADALGNRW
jgi:prepilin-type N-terminal cleavage/methylation domain-containing protein